MYNSAMEIFGYVMAFVVGTMMGSFLNVVILRINTGRSVASGRSMCTRCSRTLMWYELIPVASFLALRGKCRTCRTRISFQYPVVELGTGLLFVLLYIAIPLVQGFTPFSWLTFIFMATIGAFLIVAAVYDVRHKILPDAVIYPFLLLSVFGVVVHATIDPHFDGLRALFDGVLVALPLFILWLVSKGRVMGFGDVKLMLGIGWILGLSEGLAGLILSFWIGALFGLFLIAISRGYGMKSEVPFGPFLIIGAIIAGLWQVGLSTLFPIFI